jgi:acyl-CoA thioesterase-1
MCGQQTERGIRALIWAAALLLGGSGTVAASPGSGGSDGRQERRVILVLGDSLAAGYGLELSEAFPALLQEMIDARGWAFRVVNAGVSGDTSAGGLRRLNWLLKQKVDVLLVELGGNDGLRGITPASTAANLRAIIDQARAKYPGVHVVIAGMRMPPNMGADYLERFEQIFAAVAKEKKAGLVPFLLEGVGGSEELNQADRIHPTARGQSIIAENVWRVLRPVLERIENVSTQTDGVGDPKGAD